MCLLLFFIDESAHCDVGVDLTVFGPYEMPSLAYQYGVDDESGGFNPDACPAAGPCSVDLRTDAFAAWRADVGNETADSFEVSPLESFMSRFDMSREHELPNQGLSTPFYCCQLPKPFLFFYTTNGNY